MFPSNLNVSLDFVSGNIEILGKQNSLFPSGPVIKCLTFDFKEEETGTEHVAIATSKCVSSGIFLRVQHPCLVSIALLHFRRRYSHYSTCTTDDVISRLNLHNGKLEYLWNKQRYHKKKNAILLYFEKPFK